MTRRDRLDPDSRQLASEEAFCWRVEIVVRGRLYRPLVVAQDADGALEIALTVVADVTDLDDFARNPRPDIVGVPEQLHPVAFHHPGGASFGARQRAARRAAEVPA